MLVSVEEWNSIPNKYWEIDVVAEEGKDLVFNIDGIIMLMENLREGDKILPLNNICSCRKDMSQVMSLKDTINCYRKLCLELRDMGIACITVLNGKRHKYGWLYRLFDKKHIEYNEEADAYFIDIRYGEYAEGL